jgi:hypothetical protein
MCYLDTVPTTPDNEPHEAPSEMILERYKYILQQIHTVNENLYRFLAIYQTTATTLVGAALALFVGYRRWGIATASARGGVIGLLVLTTVTACFTIVLIIVGTVSWFDYRNEECDLTDKAVYSGFRSRPRARNLLRWYETYVVVFIIASIIVMWLLSTILLLPTMS